jgi:Helix-turn-helix
VVQSGRPAQGVDPSTHNPPPSDSELLSEHAAVDRTYVGLLERGHRGAGLDVAKRLADALGLSLAELVAEAEKEWRQSQPAEARADSPRTVVTEGKGSRQTPKSPARVGLQRRRGTRR